MPDRTMALAVSDTEAMPTDTEPGLRQAMTDVENDDDHEREGKDDIEVLKKTRRGAIRAAARVVSASGAGRTRALHDALAPVPSQARNASASASVGSGPCAG
jgi:hypothetical protein